MILCPHGCGVRLHPPVDDGGATVREHEETCSAVKRPGIESDAATREHYKRIDEAAIHKYEAAGRTAIAQFREKRFAARSAEARDWAAFAAAALAGLCSFPEHDHTLNLGKCAAEIADQLFAEYQARAEKPK